MYTFTDINTVPLSLGVAVDAEGAPVDLGENGVKAVEWGVNSANGMNFGEVAADADDMTKASFKAGEAGAEGYVTCAVTLMDDTVINGQSDLAKITTSAPVGFKVAFGDPA